MGFLQFTENTWDCDPKNRKTKLWNVSSMRGDTLGWIQWYSAWRKYIFAPSSDDVVFDAECLEDIAKRLRSETDKQKETWK